MTDLINQIRHAQTLAAEGAVVANLQRMGLVKPYDPPEETTNARLTTQEETELLDWVSACQSAYHIENSPGHRFGGLPGMLAENRAALVDYVNGMLEARKTGQMDMKVPS